MNHDAIAVQLCRDAGLSIVAADALLTRLKGGRHPDVHDNNSVLVAPTPESIISDGSTASYYELPEGATELQHLISHRDMNAQIGEIFRACYRYGKVAHSPRLRDIKKIIFYAQAELARLEKGA